MLNEVEVIEALAKGDGKATFQSNKDMPLFDLHRFPHPVEDAKNRMFVGLLDLLPKKDMDLQVYWRERWIDKDGDETFNERAKETYAKQIRLTLVVSCHKVIRVG